MKRYFKVWLKLTLNSFQTSVQSRFGALLFILGKVLRFSLVLFFIVIIATQTKVIAGYNIWEIVFIFATFNLIDVGAQFFLRGVYFFRRIILTGEFDHYLASPISPMFRSLFGAADILDTPLLFVSIGLVIYSGSKLNGLGIDGIISYLALLLNAAIIALSLHALVISLGIMTTVVDNALWLYRDVLQMGRVPIDFYREPLRGLITFIVPVGVMITFPAKAIFGDLPQSLFFASLFVGILFFTLSLFLWRYSLKKYQSASS